MHDVLQFRRQMVPPDPPLGIAVRRRFVPGFQVDSWASSVVPVVRRARRSSRCRRPIRCDEARVPSSARAYVVTREASTPLAAAAAIASARMAAPPTSSGRAAASSNARSRSEMKTPSWRFAPTPSAASDSSRRAARRSLGGGSLSCRVLGSGNRAEGRRTRSRSPSRTSRPSRFPVAAGDRPRR